MSTETIMEGWGGLKDDGGTSCICPECWVGGGSYF